MLLDKGYHIYLTADHGNVAVTAFVAGVVAGSRCGGSCEPGAGCVVGGVCTEVVKPDGACRIAARCGEQTRLQGQQCEGVLCMK